MKPAARATAVTFTVVALVGAGVAIARTYAWDVLGDAPTHHLAALGLAVLGMVALALPWRRVMRSLGATVDRRRVLAWYFTGEIGKYVPGGIWAVVGRGERARRGGVPAAAAYAGVANSLVLAYAAAATAATVGAVLVADGPGMIPLAAAVPLLVALALRPRILTPVVARIEERTGRAIGPIALPWRAALVTTARYLPAWLLIGAAMGLVADGATPELSFAAAAVAGIVAWIVGFVVVIAPGGLGAREAAFAALLPVPFGRGITIAFAARAVFVVADLALWGAATWWSARARRSVLDDVIGESRPRPRPRPTVEPTA